jgi:subtilisin family serine protease
MLAGVSAAGNVSRGFENYVSSMQGSDEITVLVVLQDQVDVAALDWQLHNAKSSMEDRHAIVVGSLQDVSKRSQGRLLADLAASKALGEVKGYTSHWLVNSVVVRTTVDGARALALRDDVEIVEPNLEVELIEPANGPQSKGFDKDTNGIGICPGVVAVGARRVWTELGINGTGAVVGVLDTGVDGTHPALSTRWRGNFAPAAECWLDAANLGDPSFPVDRHYHGTHVMGTITGLAADDSIGVAPGAQWIATNIINSSTGSAFDNGVIASLEFMADPDGNPLTLGDVPDVVQNSWGVNENFTGYFDCDSRWWAAIDNCEAAGVVLTWSAGNEGPSSTSLRSPGDRAASPYNSFSVGSTIDTPPYTISSFSSRGPSGCGGAYAMKPEICAPGDNVYSAQPGGGYQYLGGTSMAGPHIAGVVALMRAANPGLDVITIKQILMDTANDLGAVGEDNTYGHGFVDAYEAVLAVMQGYGTAEGIVTNSVTGDPVAGALVVVNGTPRATNTNALGFYSMMMEQDSYTFDYSAFGYLPGSQPVTVVEDVTTTADFVLTPAPSAMIYGYVFNDSAAPVAGATVRALGTPVTPATTDGTGYYELTLPVGSTYDVLAQAYGMGSQQVAIALTADVQQDFTLPALIFDNFESGGLAVFPWETSGDADWFVTTTDAYEGTQSVRSGVITHYEGSVLSVTVDVLAAGNIEFYYKVSSETNYDYLHFAIDGAQQGSWSGTVPWTLGSYAVSAGTRTFTWTYDKDGSVNTGSDCAWIDFVVFPTITPPAYPSVAWSPASLSQTLAPLGIAQQVITLDNNGDGDLSWTAVATMDLAGTSASAQPEAIDLPKGAIDTREGSSPLLGSGGPDGFGYTWIDSDAFGGPVYSWVEISGVGTALTDGDDITSSPLNLGFGFNFYGTDYSAVRVCSNGWLSFSSTVTTYTNAAIPNTAEPNNMIAPFWDDLNPLSAGTVYYYADAANQRFIVQWDAVVRYGTTEAETFQAILNADDTIVYQYKTMTGTLNSATIGIENATGTDGLQTVFNAAYVHNSLAVLLSFVPPPDPWLSIAPESGALPGHTADGEITVTFDATILLDGVYTGNVVISTNDPDHYQIVVPVTLTVTSTVGVEDPGDDTHGANAVPRVTQLFQNAPNPFNPATVIAFDLSRPSAVSLEIYDLRGLLVRRLVQGNLPARHHALTWDGRTDSGQQAPSGTYLYRLRSDETTFSKSMLLLK